MEMNQKRAILLTLWLVMVIAPLGAMGKRDTANNLLVLQSDFGLRDGAVASMIGIALKVSPDIHIYDLSHNISRFSIWEAAYRLYQTVPYWPSGTVFVSLVNPGPKLNLSIVVTKTRDGHYIVTPDNGTLTLIDDYLFAEEVREVDKELHQLSPLVDLFSLSSKDLCAYVGAKLASGQLTFEEVGPLLDREIVKLVYPRAKSIDGTLQGNIPTLDVRYGNVWTNIPGSLVKASGMKKGTLYLVEIYNNSQLVYKGRIPFAETFGGVPRGTPLLYLNPTLHLSIAINWGDFAATYGVGAGTSWEVFVSLE